MITAYHFVGTVLCDGRPVPPDGKWLEHDGPLVLCESGLHASLDPFDALTYAAGDTLCLVEMDGEIIDGDDKLVARRRRIVRRIDATDLVRRFARQCALSVAHLWECPDIVRQYLETGDDALRVAARAAALVAARAAALATVSATVSDAVSDAVWATARAAATSRQRVRFRALVNEAFKL